MTGISRHATHIGKYKQNILAVLFCRSHCKCAWKSQFVIKSSSCHQPWCSFCRRGCQPQQVETKGFTSTAKWHFRWTATSVRLFWEMNMNVPFCQLAATDWVTPFSHIHTLRRGEGPYARTPHHRFAKQLHERPIYQVHMCCQYIGEVILAQLEDSRQTLRDCRSNLWHPTVFLLEQAVHDVRGCHYFNIATSPRHVFAHARGPRCDRDPRSSRELCAQVTPRSSMVKGDSDALTYLVIIIAKGWFLGSFEREKKREKERERKRERERERKRERKRERREE